MVLKGNKFYPEDKVPTPDELPPFPAKWPSKPIPYMPTEVDDYFEGPFKLQVHPQKFRIPMNGKFEFGIKNPTNEKVIYLLYDQSTDLTIVNQKGEKNRRGTLKPGEIVRLTVVHKEVVAYEPQGRVLQVSYKPFEQETKPKVEKKKRDDNYPTDSTYSAPIPYYQKKEDELNEWKAHYYTRMIVDPEPKLHERPPKSVHPSHYSTYTS